MMINFRDSFLRFMVGVVVMLVIQSCQSVPDTGNGLVQVESGGENRDFWYFVPDEAEHPMPLIVLLHPEGSNGLRMINLGRFMTQAKINHYALAAPNIFEREFKEAGSNFSSNNFLVNVIDTIAKDKRIDSSQIFMVGYSSGASMALRFATSSGEMLAGLAVVAGQVPEKLPEKLMPVSTIFIQGDSDPVMPVQGIKNSDGWLLLPPRMSFVRWAKAMKCSISVSSTIDFVRYTKRTGCPNRVSVVYMEVQGLGHYWPKPNQNASPVLLNARRGPELGRLDAASVIWDFFGKEMKHRRLSNQ